VGLKLLLKRGALVAAANWPIVAVQFVAETTFQVLLAVPVIGAAVLVAALLGGDLADLLRGNLRDIFSTIASTLVSEPVALIAFMTAFTIVLLGGSLLMFIVKGGTVEVLLTAESMAGPIESEPLAYHTVIQEASHFTLDRFLAGCRRLYRRYIWLGLVLMIVYGLSGGAYLTFVAYGYKAAAGRLLVISWIFNTALATVALVLWLTFVNWWYLLLQIVMASEDLGLVPAVAEAGRFVRAEFRELAGMFGVILIVIVAATFASALAWSGVGLIAFVPLVGLAVFPLQIAALVVRGLVFEYIGLGALTAYATLYHRYLAGCGRVTRPSTAARLKPLDGHI
jgi:hypothetical protein